MSQKFKNKYRIPSARASWWDYGSNGAYFVTICTKNKENFFGAISKGKVHLSELGVLATQYWLEIPQRYSFVKLGAFVIMPNHMHAIVLIDKSIETGDESSVPGRDAINRVCTKPPINRVCTKNPTTSEGGITSNHNPMLHKNLSRIIRWYKGRVTFEARYINPSFAWQSRFYDHIIRDAESFQRIISYIDYNPQKWNEDEYNQ